MKRLHIHVGVENIDKSIRFYSDLFGADPVKTKADYAKWLLDDPRVTFAISTRASEKEVDHLGIQVDENVELDDLRERLKNPDMALCSMKEKRFAAMPGQINHGYKTRRAFHGKRIERWKMHRFFQVNPLMQKAHAAHQKQWERLTAANLRKRQPGVAPDGR